MEFFGFSRQPNVNQTVAVLGQMGYTKVNNIGGISAYRGKVER